MSHTKVVDTFSLASNKLGLAGWGDLMDGCDETAFAQFSKGEARWSLDQENAIVEGRKSCTTGDV